MPNTTTNFSFNKPLVNDAVDEDLWGGQLNDNWDSIDGILPVPAASKFGALVAQSTDDASFEIISGQGVVGTVPVSQGADALPIFTAMWPVGSIYMNKTDATNPGTLFGFGTWVAIEDKFIVSRGSTFTATGGAETVTLAVTNLPDHNHNMKGDQGSSGNADFVESAASGTGNDIATSSTGSGTAFSIIPPYQAVYTWERTA